MRPARRASPTTTRRARALTREVAASARLLGGSVAVLWAVLAVDTLVFAGGLRGFGIVPRTVDGLRGIAFAPFLHADSTHLVLNTIGLATLGGIVLLRDRRHFAVVTLLGALVSGLGTWAVGRPAVHLGASGVIFAYLGYLLLAGVFERRVGTVLLSALAAWGFGGMVWQLLPHDGRVSWEAHAFGFVGGALAARRLARRGRR
jgi:membrane associated rhomboid family serine protease